MKVSVVIPVFNEQGYISSCLDSLIKQTVKPDEIIICDNGSTDSSVKIIKSYQQLLPIKIVTEKHKGICYAMEKAWRSSSGDLILRTDADCILPDNWVDKFISFYLRDPKLSACGGGFRASDGSLFIRLITPLAVTIDHCSLHLFQGSRFLFAANFSIKRSVLEKINGYKSSQKIPDDLLISRKLKQYGYKYRYFPFFTIYTSTRRFNNLRSLFFGILSTLNPKFYFEKSK